MKNNLAVIFLIINAFTGIAIAQDLRIWSTKKAVDLGEVFDLNLQIIHDGNSVFELVEQDSILYSFEIASFDLKATSQKNKRFVDSIQLKIRTFSVKDSIPVFLKVKEIKGIKSHFLTSNILWIKIKDPTIKGFSDQVLPSKDYIHLPVRLDKNMVGFVLILCVLFVVLFVVYWLPKIISKYQKEVFIREHEQFVIHISEMSFDSKDALDAWLALWKKDIQQSLGKNLDAYTISQLKFEFKHLKNDFNALESILYTKDGAPVTKEILEHLIYFSNRKFEEKLSQWK